jgi:endonuclease G, mitochondrial
MSYTSTRSHDQIYYLLRLIRRYPQMLPPDLGSVAVEALIQRDKWSLDIGGFKAIIDEQNPSFPTDKGVCQTPTGSTWRHLIEERREVLDRAIACVGRIEITKCGVEQIQGTGWLIHSDVVVTNRHIALGLQRFLTDGTANLRIDLLEETETGPAREFAVDRVLKIENDIDLAFLKIETHGQDTPVLDLPLAMKTRKGVRACVIGYPANPDIIYSSALLYRIFADVFDVKRLAPGYVLADPDARIDHDCTTLGGNSGSLLLDLDAGEILGIHYGASPGANHALAASVIYDRLGQL